MLKSNVKFNEQCQNELEKYKKLDEAEGFKDWLRSNLDLGLNQWESFGDEYPKIKVGHFVNGKDCNGAYESIDVFVVLADFRQIYTFKALFDDLFFEKKSASQGLKGA